MGLIDSLKNILNEAYKTGYSSGTQEPFPYHQKKWVTQKDYKYKRIFFFYQENVNRSVEVAVMMSAK